LSSLPRHQRQRVEIFEEGKIMSTSIKQFSGRIEAALRASWQMRAMAIVEAILVNVVILIVGRLIIGEFPVATVSGDDQTIGLGPVILVTALVGLVAWGLLALLERTTSRAKTVWTAIAVVVLALSMFGPLGSGVNTSSKVVLACMHVGAAATIIPIFRRSVATR
jgi:hypothetical protein